VYIALTTDPSRELTALPSSDMVLVQMLLDYFLFAKAYEVIVMHACHSA
jgi:hypothetical protein